jgi:hypothetical protein
MPRAQGRPFGGGFNLLLVAGAAYLVWDHQQGRHEQSQLLCPMCLLNRILPAPAEPGGASPAEPPEHP